MDYALLRTQQGDGTERHLAGSFTVPPGGITIHLGYDYSEASPPALPDTALVPPETRAAAGE
ncbi:MAG TPA: hypothetical protein VEW95_04065 [Candidatus Limnocylindrales bacterium]|nr:hypothetical protein [Candidatus Limnocylindrales bacterium]